MLVCYGLIYCSLWFFSHLRLKLYSIYFCHSIESSPDILLVRLCVQTHLLLEFFILPSLLSFVFPICQILSRSPKPSFLTHSLNRGQFSVVHLYRSQFQHCHQWYVSIKLSAPLLSSATKWTPAHSAVTVTYDGLKHIKMSLSLLTQCMKMCVPL